MRRTPVRWKGTFVLLGALGPSAGCSKIIGLDDVPPATDVSSGGQDAGFDGASDGSAPDGSAPDRSTPDGSTGCSGTQCGATCTDTSSDPRNCGACNHDCTALMHIGTVDGVTCAGGRCVIPPTSCASGYAHCTANADDGCETDIGTATHCGSCAKQCSTDAPLCAAGQCVTSCPAATPTLCGTTCANLDNDANHCSDCAKACAQPATGGTTTCDSRQCVVHCFGGSPECAGNCPDYQTDNQNCGTCGHACSGGSTCKSGVCCSPTQTNCGGACVDISTDPDHCGACTSAVCPNISGATRNCVNRVCSPTCNDGRLLCSGTCCPLSPPNATMSCDVGVCTPHCVGLTLSCSGGATQCGSWNFESNTGEGWQGVLTSLGNATNLQIKTAPGGSLSFSFQVTNGTSYTTIRVPLCNGQMAAAKNHSITAQVYVEGPTLQVNSSMENSAQFYWSDTSDTILGGVGAYLLYPGNMWVSVGDGSIILSDGVASLSITISVETGWSGTVYIDNIQLR